MGLRLLPRVVILVLTVLTANTVAAGVTVTLDPAAGLTVPVNGVRQFRATVAGTTNTAVTWSLRPPAGVDPGAVGTIDATGKYTAPPKPLPGFAGVTVTATSVADATARASNTVTVRYATPTLGSLAPNTLSLGTFTLTVNGGNFVSGARVLWNGQPLSTNFVSAAQLTATGTAAQVGAASITVANPGPGAVSTPLTLSVTSQLSVVVSPGSVSLPPGGMQQFHVTVTGSSVQGVT